MTPQETIESLYERFAARDNEAIRALFADNIVWKQMEGFPNGGVYQGADTIFTGVFQGFREHWSAWRAVVDSYVTQGPQVIALGGYNGTYSATGRTISARFAHLYEVHGGKVTRFEQFTDTALIAWAMGRV